MKECSICKKSFSRLGFHLKTVHKMTSKAYYDEFLKTNVINKCPICNNDLAFCSINKGYFKTCGSRRCAANKAILIDPDKTHKLRSKMMKDRWNNSSFKDSTRRKMQQSAISRKDQLSENAKKLWQDEEWRNKTLLSKRKASSSPDHRKLLSKRLKEVCNTVEHKKIKSDAARKCWEREEYRERLKLSLENAFSCFKINKQEQRVLNILKDMSLDDFEYVGDWSFFIRSKNPDFISEERKKIIEFYGTYWHRNDTAEDIQRRKDIFKAAGYETLIIWEKELDDKTKCIEKIKTFIGEIT